MQTQLSPWLVPALDADHDRERGVEIRVVQDDRRRLAAELEHARLDQLAAHLADLLADLDRAGEA